MCKEKPVIFPSAHFTLWYFRWITTSNKQSSLLVVRGGVLPSLKDGSFVIEKYLERTPPSKSTTHFWCSCEPIISVEFPDLSRGYPGGWFVGCRRAPPEIWGRSSACCVRAPLGAGPPEGGLCQQRTHRKSGDGPCTDAAGNADLWECVMCASVTMYVWVIDDGGLWKVFAELWCK